MESETYTTLAVPRGLAKMIRMLAVRKDMPLQVVTERLLRFALNQHDSKVFPQTNNRKQTHD